MSSRWRLLHGCNSRKQSNQLRRTRKDAETDARGDSRWSPALRAQVMTAAQSAATETENETVRPGVGGCAGREDHRGGLAFPRSGRTDGTWRVDPRWKLRGGWNMGGIVPLRPPHSKCVCDGVRSSFAYAGLIWRAQTRPQQTNPLILYLRARVCETTRSIPPQLKSWTITPDLFLTRSRSDRCRFHCHLNPLMTRSSSLHSCKGLFNKVLTLLLGNQGHDWDADSSSNRMTFRWFWLVVRQKNPSSNWRWKGFFFF